MDARLPSTCPRAPSPADTEPNFMLLHRNIGGGLTGLDREEGCIGGDGLVATGPQGEQATPVQDLRVGDQIFSPSLGREVQILAIVRSEMRLPRKIRDLRVSNKHPVRFSGAEDWMLPRDSAEEIASPRVTDAYSLVLDAGGTLLVNKAKDGGVWVATLGPSPPEAGLGALKHSWYNSDEIITSLRNRDDWPYCQGLPPQSYFSADASEDMSPSPQPPAPLLVPADEPGPDDSAHGDESSSTVRAVLSRLLGVGPCALEPVRRRLHYALWQVNPAITGGGGYPWQDLVLVLCF